MEHTVRRRVSGWTSLELKSERFSCHTNLFIYADAFLSCSSLHSRCSRVCCEPIQNSTTTKTTLQDCGSTSASGDALTAVYCTCFWWSLTRTLALVVVCRRSKGFLCVVVFRVFSDRLVDRTDLEAFVGLLGKNLASLFDLTFHSICPNKQPPIFGTVFWSSED